MNPLPFGLLSRLSPPGNVAAFCHEPGRAVVQLHCMGSGTRRQLLVARPEQLWLLASGRRKGGNSRGIYRRVRDIGVCSLRQLLARGRGRENRYLHGRSYADPCGKAACRRNLDKQAWPSRRHLPSDFGCTRGRVIRKRGANNVETGAGVILLVGESCRGVRLTFCALPCKTQNVRMTPVSAGVCAVSDPGGGPLGFPAAREDARGVHHSGCGFRRRHGYRWRDGRCPGGL